MKTDEQIVKSVQTGHKAEFAEIINRYEKRLFGYIIRTLRDSEAAEDVVSETFLKAYKNLQSFDVKRNFSAWIYRIAHNELMNYLRFRMKVKNDNQFIETIVEEGFVEKLHKELDAPFEKKRLKSALKKLPLRYREAINLKYFEELSYEEIAEIMRIPQGTVGTILNRAKNELRLYLGEER